CPFRLQKAVLSPLWLFCFLGDFIVEKIEGFQPYCFRFFNVSFRLPGKMHLVGLFSAYFLLNMGNGVVASALTATKRSLGICLTKPAARVHGWFYFAVTT
ncbi:hypothetical protein CEXT_767131, partial [Caerostris extrusa]